MYADDTVVYVHGKNKSEAASKLSAAMVHISDWLNQSWLQLNIAKTVTMFFTKTVNNTKNYYLFQLKENPYRMYLNLNIWALTWIHNYHLSLI